MSYFQTYVLLSGCFTYLHRWFTLQLSRYLYMMRLTFSLAPPSLSHHTSGTARAQSTSISKSPHT
ncbi:hypothetical protein K402DRAFT_126737 [Aulographum hederae CBS 113979]|uniref:Uncharacterized protein n=1 Tax=Aulographum hederae CBS 113979 TaxID=1176131 RepID=A0A6G1HEB1_9PEZI|nr:hypothetical protein K402DRAFT_126737 [Aulographum hederae CBS 113979]